MVGYFVLFFVLGFISALNVVFSVFNYNKYKESKVMVKQPQKSNSEVDLEEDKDDNVNIYETSKLMDIFDEYMNGGEGERGR